MRATYPTRTTITVSGDISFDFDGEALVDIYEILGGQFPDGTSLLTASVGQGAHEDGEHLLRWTADLAPGEYRGPGTYDIDGANAPRIAEASGIRSAAYFSIVGPAAGPVGVGMYDRLVQPCTLTYEREAIRGVVECPALGHEEDESRTIAWTWTWERLPDIETFDAPDDESPQSPDDESP